MYISKESLEQTNVRLRAVIRTALVEFYDTPYYFKETPIDDFRFDAQALAMVKDDEVWSFLVPTVHTDAEHFKIFRFHFQDGLDNSGFVGWLASTIKERLGSGVFVICGQNSNRGGIFDYWGCPMQMSDEVMQLINDLRK